MGDSYVRADCSVFLTVPGLGLGPCIPPLPAPKDAQAGGWGVGPRPHLKGKWGWEETHTNLDPLG